MILKIIIAIIVIVIGIVVNYFNALYDEDFKE